MKPSLTHLDDQDQPRMVDVSQKMVTARSATAHGRVVFPSEAWTHLSENGFTTKKGSIITVAIVAGTQAVKRTADWIPFCHPLPIDGCQIEIKPLAEERTLEVICTVKTTHRTGVEMEALTGVSAAALTIYDMTKALSHEIIIKDVQLFAKSGGKRDYSRNS
jgi:cyclic pyranopterin phosphate synthase